MIFGKQAGAPRAFVFKLTKGQDTHVPREGRDLIRKTLEDANVPVTVSVKVLFVS